MGTICYQIEVLYGGKAKNRFMFNTYVGTTFTFVHLKTTLIKRIQTSWSDAKTMQEKQQLLQNIADSQTINALEDAFLNALYWDIRITKPKGM